MSPSAPLDQEEQEEQYPIEQTICGTLQKENNWKCFILTTLILGCLAAVSWCRFTHVTKVVINFSLYPIRSARQMSPCEEGYIYIPVAFMAMLYLVYLVECWHCTARVQLGYREDAGAVLHKVHQMRQALPIVWWKAVCYHYVRRKRQVTRYRNGDSFTSTQVYYERVNSHAAGSSFVFAYCGVKDISRKLVLHQTKGPITKIRFSKGFAFANVAAAAEFEEQRSRFFAEQERHDDYMEMREGLDLTDVTGFREHVVAMADPDRPPWYARAPVFWLCSFLLLSWPLRILLEYNTAYVHYQVTKLFGVNYDATTSVATTPSVAPQICLSRGGGQMSHCTSVADSNELEWCIRENVSLVPSYSEALLMATDGQQCCVPSAVSSYSVRTVATTNNNNITNSEQVQPQEECAARRSWGSILNFHGHRSSWSRASAQFETTLIRSQTTTKDIGGHPEDIGSPSTWDSEGISCDKGESSFENISDQKSLETSMEVIQPVAQDSPRRPIPHFDEKKKNQNTEDEIAPTNPIEFNQNDPQFFVNKKLSPEMINEALKLEQQNLDRIDLASGRKFNTKLKRVLLPNGTTRERNWLVYSKSSDAVFCLHCLIFALPSERTIWSTTGYRGWVDHRGDRDIELHEKSKMHASSQIARLQWISKARVDKDLSKQKDELVNHHRAVLSVIIDCCRYLVNEMLAFRSKDSLDGKLANLFKLLAKYNPDARVYLEKLEKSKEKNKKLSTNLLSYRNLYDLLNVINNIVISKIVERVNETKTFSLIIDSTQDVSKKECTTILLRYVEHRDELAEMKANVKPEERLVNVFTSGDTSGEYLSTKILNTLQKLGIDKNGMVGQSMDGAGNMRGRISGAKSFILRECPKAFYIWCCSHRFALVVEKSMELCPKIRDMFSLLQELYNFMSGHKRHHLFVKKLEAGACEARRKRLKRVNTTRWSSKSESVKTIVSCYDAVRETLEDISEDTKSESESRVSAKGLLKAISDFETYAVMQIVMEVFRVLSPVTICLQSKVIDYGIVPSMVSDTISKLEKMRTDEGWEKITDKINTFSSEHNLRAITNQRIRKRKRFMDELAIDETPTDPMAKLRTNVFFNVLDCVINHLKDRFPENSLNIVEQMIYFSHEKLLEFEDNNLSSNLFKDFCEYYNLDCNIICEELNAFSQLYKVSYRNIDLSDVLSSNNDNVSSSEEETEKQDFSTGSLANLDESSKLVRERYQDQWIKKGFIRPYRCLLNFSGFPYLTNIYQIILSLPATSCSAERTMSKLKIIKNRLRSSMGDMWLSEMLVLSAEKDILKSISNNEIIDKFALSSENRKKLLLYSGYQ